jgi:hypothetical protein
MAHDRLGRLKQQSNGSLQMIKCVTWVSIVALCSCVVAPQAFAETLVFIISYHNVDYAKAACERVLSKQKSGLGEVNDENITTGATECKSVRDTRELGRRLENEVLDALAAEPLCAGITMIRDPHPEFDRGGFSENLSQENHALKQAYPHWDLHLDYQPGSKVFGWAMYRNKAGMRPDGPLLSGEGNASKAAKAICTIASGPGATSR